MYSLTYVSSAVEPFTARQLRELLTICHKNNGQRGITGMLLYKDGNFMQVLEGEEAQVMATHRSIALDARHRGLITLLQGPTPRREFGLWLMGFQDLGVGADLDGYSEFLNVPLTGKEFQTCPSQAQKLLLSFKKHVESDG